MHSKSKNTEIIEELFWSLLFRYQEGLEEPMRASNVVSTVLRDCITKAVR